MNDAPHTADDRVPPGQYVTDKWPVLTYGETPRIDKSRWTFRIFGLVGEEIVLTWKDFRALPRVKVTADFHCVTRFSTLDNAWGGVATRNAAKPPLRCESDNRNQSAPTTNAVERYAVHGDRSQRRRSLA